MIVRFSKKHKVRGTAFVEPDEIFLDSKNIANFDRQQFEGRIEKPISKNTLLFVGGFFFLIVAVYGFRLGYLQIQKGEAYFQTSENNILEKQIIFAERGIIFDRNKVELAWNNKGEGDIFPTRKYLNSGFAHLLGYVSYPAKDSSGNYWQSEFVGKNGLEKQYADRLSGINGSKIVETDARKTIHSENTVNAPKRGEDLVTTVDSRVQAELFRFIKNLSTSNNFTGGAGVLMDINNGEILASTSFPEYNSEILSLGKDASTIKTYLNDNRKVFMDRTISGLYTPGSIVKPFFALGALMERIISPNKEILSTGSISIPNPYFPEQSSVFKDWKAHGWTAMREAIAVSSDVYFYALGGGYQDQTGIGISNIEKYSKLFGIGTKTGVDLPNEKSGVIPNPTWKLENFAGDPWRIGDTYNTVIGQYGFQVTLMEMVRATASLVNGGKLLTPHYLLGDKKMEESFTQLDLDKEHLKIIQEGMREAVTYGTAVALNVPYVDVAAKTGTAQLGAKKNRVNSWIIGFFPYEKPKYAFTIMMESGPANGSVGASSVMRELLDWMSTHAREYLE